MVACLSLIDVITLGVLFDAGGNNRRFSRMLLRDDNDIKHSKPQRLSFRTMFFDNVWLIFVWYCSTHNLKSCRNQLKASSGTDKSTRIFHDCEKIYFGWPSNRTQLSREQERLNK